MVWDGGAPLTLRGQQTSGPWFLPGRRYVAWPPLQYTQVFFRRGGWRHYSLEANLQSIEASYLGELDELERVKAEAFLERAKQVADEQWREVGLGRAHSASAAPQAHAVYSREDEELPP